MFCILAQFMRAFLTMKTIVVFLLAVVTIVACTPAAVTPPPDACTDAGPLEKKKCPSCPCADAAPAPAPTPAPVPTVAPDATPAPAPVGYAAVCQHLAKLGCPEGQSPRCPILIGKVQDASLGDLKPACLMAATTQQAVQACGSVVCQTLVPEKKPR